MNRAFTFTLSKEEYLNYLRFQSLGSKQGRSFRLWLRICVPALLLCIVIYFQLYAQFIWPILALVASAIWLFYACPMIWKKYVYKRIDENTLKQMNISGFQKIEVTFKDDKIIYKDAKKHEIPYGEVRGMMPIENMFVFMYHQQDVLLLPFRLFDSEDDISEFFKDFEIVWKPFCT